MSDLLVLMGLEVSEPDVEVWLAEHHEDFAVDVTVFPKKERVCGTHRFE